MVLCCYVVGGCIFVLLMGLIVRVFSHPSGTDTSFESDGLVVGFVATSSSADWLLPLLLPPLIFFFVSFVLIFSNGTRTTTAWHILDKQKYDGKSHVPFSCKKRVRQSGKKRWRRSSSNLPNIPLLFLVCFILFFFILDCHLRG